MHKLLKPKVSEAKEKIHRSEEKRFRSSQEILMYDNLKKGMC
jgi:hypothetical protein